MMLFFTKFQRSANEIETAKLRNFGAKQDNLHRMAKMVDEGQSILLNYDEPMDRFGALLDEAWRLKRDLSSAVSSTDIDEAYKAAMAAGASGGKLLGAGGGGFLLFIVKPAWREKVRQALSSLVEVPVKMENRGSHLALYDPALDDFSETSLGPDSGKNRAAVA
jgi:D-glycero-alpha-D-manno-heptose-7-phosphate kinase